jgi:AAA+ superfamily predicted ATPase
MKTKVLNFFGGPGTGKSTIAANVLGELDNIMILLEMYASLLGTQKIWIISTPTLLWPVN